MREGTMQGKGRYVALYHALVTDESFSLHAYGCRDIKREAQEHGSNEEVIEAADANEAVGIMLDEELQEMGYGPEHVKVHACARSRSGSGRKESTMEANVITLDQVEAGMLVRPVPGSYRSRLTRTEKRHGARPVTVTFGPEFAGTKFKRVSRTGAAKRPGTLDIGFGQGDGWHAYPGTVKVEIKGKATRTRKAAPTATKERAQTPRQRQQERAATNGTPEQPTTKRTRQPVDASLAAKVKEERDKNGTAWWQIGVKFGLPGAGPLPKGKAGAGQARKLYKAASGGTLPTSARSEGGSRNARGTSNPRPAARRRAALGLANMEALEVRERLEGKRITYTYDKKELGEAEPVRVEKVRKVHAVGKRERMAVTFFSERSREGYGNERTVYLDQIVEVA